MTSRLATRDSDRTRGSSVAWPVWLAALASLLIVTSAGAQGTMQYVAARPLARGQVLTAEDLRPAGATSVPGASRESRVALVGWIARRVIAPGEPLRAPSIAPPNVVEPGQAVAVVWREPGIEVRVKGVAANAAAAGERVTVRIDLRRRLEGVAVAPGLVQIQ